MRRVMLAGLLLAVAAWPAEPVKAPVAANPVVQIRGRITRVNSFGPQYGMPSIQVDANGTTTKVVLGSIRYLMEQNFNARVGTEVQIKGYQLPDFVVAIEIRVPAENKTIKLRDQNGWPVWRGGPGAYVRAEGST
ncbi:MAG: hypothetical protein SGI92_20225 [Bryobacteraceae bacterium]|nr:hypothetical protein [Bryobacteraceae bacterium]